MAHPHAIFFSPDSGRPPEVVRGWLAARGLPIVVSCDVADLMARALRGRPTVVVFDARANPAAALNACRRLKGDSYTGVVPGGVLTGDDESAVTGALDALADEVFPASMRPAEAALRFDAMLRRADRDVHVHPSTRLPGAPEIESEIGRRIASGEPFAVCYLDLDNFKAFADTFGFATADIVIRGLGAAIRDSAYAVAGEGNGDFVGHIGGDDFIVVTTQPIAEAVVREVARRFRDVIARAVGDEAAESGSFTGVDRDGHIKRFPLARVSAAVMNVCPDKWVNLAHFGMQAADAKRRAKQQGAGSILVETV